MQVRRILWTSLLLVGDFYMKKLLILSLFCIFLANCGQATELNSIFYGIRSGIDVLSDVNRLRGQVNQTNAQQQQLQSQQQAPEIRQNPQPTNTQNSYYAPENINNSYDTSARNEGTAFTAKSKFAEGNIYLRQEKYREAIDSYYEAMKLFESIGDIENAQKAGQAYDEAIEMRCEFGDYCL